MRKEGHGEAGERMLSDGATRREEGDRKESQVGVESYEGAESEPRSAVTAGDRGRRVEEGESAVGAAGRVQKEEEPAEGQEEGRSRWKGGTGGVRRRGGSRRGVEAENQCAARG